MAIPVVQNPFINPVGGMPGQSLDVFQISVQPTIVEVSSSSYTIVLNLTTSDPVVPLFVSSNIIKDLRDPTSEACLSQDD